MMLWLLPADSVQYSIMVSIFLHLKHFICHNIWSLPARVEAKHVEVREEVPDLMDHVQQVIRTGPPARVVTLPIKTYTDINVPDLVDHVQQVIDITYPAGV
jgi:hypothetical protein